MDIAGLRAFHNWVKSTLISTYGAGADNLLDLGCGVGGDIRKWVSAGIKNVIGFDINDDSIAEANRRLAQIKESNATIRIHFFHLNTGEEDISAFLEAKKLSRLFDVVSNQFALHHLFASETMCRQHIENVSKNLKEGGYYIGTIFDGEKTFTLLKNTVPGDKVVRSEGSQASFSIKKCYENQGDDFSALPLFGQKIEVILEGSPLIGKPTVEYLVDFNKFVEFIKPFGLELVESQHFANFFEEWESAYPALALSALEREFSSLNRTFVFKKIPVKP